MATAADGPGLRREPRVYQVAPEDGSRVVVSSTARLEPGASRRSMHCAELAAAEVPVVARP